MKLPEIKIENGIGTLYVDGRPFICLGGELHNSASSSTEWMRQEVWPALRPLHINSVIAMVAWEQLEPTPGQFCFSVLDDLIADAASEGLKLILIWFGLWKNGSSTYVPEWVKLDREKYWVCVPENATHIPPQWGEAAHMTISPLCDSAVVADAAAFRKLMQHIREVDKTGTVIMVQVENEIGLIGSPRDCSPAANEAFYAPVPEPVAKEFGVSGNWKEAFGTEASEQFMAWHYGLAVETIMRAGQAEHPLPMFVNAWLEQYPARAGVYPSGGPIAKVMRMWRLAAPSICLYAPDIYLPDFEKVCAEYAADGNPLFIPETATNVRSAATVFLAVCEYSAIGFHPFGIETVCGKKPELDLGMLAALNIDVSAFSDEGTDIYLPESYRLLHSLMPLIREARGTERLRGFCHYGTDGGRILAFKGCDVHIMYGRMAPGKPPAGGAVLELSPDEFLVFGTNFKAEFLPKLGDEAHVETLSIEEGDYVDGVWRRGRIWNGDERHVSLSCMPQILRVKLYRY